MKVLTLRFGEGESIEIHMLNVGDAFEGFGGSRHPLVAGQVFATGKKMRRPTASIVTRRTGPMGIEDKEYDIHDASFWGWIGRLINNTAGDVLAEGDEVKLAHAD